VGRCATTRASPWSASRAVPTGETGGDRS
jgi:hypothetical protein